MPCYWCICHNNTLEFDFQQLQQISIKKSFFFWLNLLQFYFFWVNWEDLAKLRGVVASRF